MHIRYDAVNLPADQSFLLNRHIYNNADGEEVIDFLKGDVLFLDLVPDGVNGLGTPHDFVRDTKVIKLLAQRLNKSGNISFP
jgi:hypothetical protein